MFVSSLRDKPSVILSFRCFNYMPIQLNDYAQKRYKTISGSTLLFVSELEDLKFMHNIIPDKRYIAEDYCLSRYYQH